jgi:hypothetical protein
LVKDPAGKLLVARLIFLHARWRVIGGGRFTPNLPVSCHYLDKSMTKGILGHGQTTGID